MIFGHHKITCRHHQHTNLQDVFLTSTSLTSLKDVPLKTQVCLGISQNQDGSNMGAWDKLALENQDCEDNRSLLHPSSFEQPTAKKASETMMKNATSPGKHLIYNSISLGVADFLQQV